MSGIKLTLRALQLILSVSALATAARGFRSASIENDVPDFTVLMQTVALYSLLLLVGVQPLQGAEMLADVIMFALTLASGIVLLNSSYKSNNCGSHSYDYSSYSDSGCGKLTGAVWCTFLAMALFVLTFFVAFGSEKKPSSEVAAQDQYVAGTTPINNNLSPVANV